MVTRQETRVGPSSAARHEAAEALGAIASAECLEALEEASTDECQVVRETAVMALQRLRQGLTLAHFRAQQEDLRDTSLTLELNLSTFAPHPPINSGICGTNEA